METKIAVVGLISGMVAVVAGCGHLAVSVSQSSTGAIRVITYNVRSFEGYVNDNQWTRCEHVRRRGQMLERFALELALYDPTILCLQEVPSESTAADLAERLGMHYAHFPGGWKSKGWPEGISGAVLSKYPIIEAASHPSLNWTERPEDLFTRFWGRAVLDTPFGKCAVHGMHGYHRDSETRLRELTEVLAVIETDLAKGLSVILLGDLNHRPSSEEYKRIRESGLVDTLAGRTDAESLTCPSTSPEERIDYIWVGGALAQTIDSAEVLFEGAFRTNPQDPQSYALSDHLPVQAVLSPAAPWQEK